MTEFSRYATVTFDRDTPLTTATNVNNIVVGDNDCDEQCCYH